MLFNKKSKKNKIEKILEKYLSKVVLLKAVNEYETTRNILEEFVSFLKRQRPDLKNIDELGKEDANFYYDYLLKFHPDKHNVKRHIVEIGRFILFADQNGYVDIMDKWK